jgi:hypothetical protein
MERGHWPNSYDAAAKGIKKEEIGVHNVQREKRTAQKPRNKKE